MSESTRKLPIGVAFTGIVNTDADNFDIDTRFRMAKEAGVFDYIERMPPPGEIDAYVRASEKHSLPLRVGSFYYTLGRDEALLDWHLRICREIGATTLNVQIMTHDADGRIVNDEDIVRTFMWAHERGNLFGVTPSLEVHVNMWSEHFGRVSRVGEEIERRGAAFNITLDHSHVIFKIGNQKEQEIQGMRADIEAGLLELDPSVPGNICAEWIERNYVCHAHARSTVPASVTNLWATHPDGRHGRGIQYPFVRPARGEWHCEWDEARLAAWKSVALQLLDHHARSGSSRLGQITTEFIPFVDYGAGAKYSLFDNNVACAIWLRDHWDALQRPC